jgi:hypothetical protein
MEFTIIHNSGGFHGHQLKDYFGGLAAAKVLGMRYAYTPYKYLDFFAVNDSEAPLSIWRRKLPFFRSHLTGPHWDGFETYAEFRRQVDLELSKGNDKQLIVFEKAFRVHPHQTLRWLDDGLIERNVFQEIVAETTAKYWRRHQIPGEREGPLAIEVAMHISRGGDFDPVTFPEHFEDPYNVRYMFSMEYFMCIYQQVRESFPGRKLHFSIYTEELNSEDIVQAFSSKEDVTINIGCNRSKPDEQLIEGIFKAFVSANILVSCNSSFSTMAVFFRGNKPTIYHPHRHMDNLPPWPYLKTDKKGNFSVDRLVQGL